METGTRLDEYVLDSVLGKPGGFGIAYRARDQFDRPVVIKEYFPNDLALREGDSFSVRPKSEDDEEFFRWGMQRFLDEARTLSRFDHPGIVKVVRYFERNNTGYFVMPYEEGEDLRKRLSRGVMDERELRALIDPLLGALEEVHHAGIWHRDIKPSNIYLRKRDGSPVLLDFGAARQAMGERSKSMTSVLTPPYAPFEQYSRDPRNQGPWTDIYAVGVVAYEALSGRQPPDSTDRIYSDPLEPLPRDGRMYTAALIDGITAALQVRHVNRPQSVAEWRKQLQLAPIKPNPVPVPETTPDPLSGRTPARKFKFELGISAGAIILLIAVIALQSVLQSRSSNETAAADAFAAPAPAEPAPAEPASLESPRDQQSNPAPAASGAPAAPWLLLNCGSPRISALSRISNFLPIMQSAPVS